MPETDTYNVMYGILNKDKNILLTSASGRGAWMSEDKARKVMKMEFGGGQHLSVVTIINAEFE